MNKNIKIKGKDLLTLAAMNKAEKSAQALLMLGFNPFTKAMGGKSAADMAKSKKDKKMLILFAKFKKSLEAKDKNEEEQENNEANEEDKKSS